MSLVHSWGTFPCRLRRPGAAGDSRGSLPPALAVMPFLILTLLPAPGWSEQEPAPSPPPRRLSLHDALDLALHDAPAIAAAAAARERSNVAVTRAELDRFSLRIDAFLTEQLQVSNLLGPAPAPSCVALLQSSPALFAPLQLQTADGSAPTAAQCQAAAGSYLTSDAITLAAEGEFNLSANLQVPLFSGFRVTSTINHARAMRDAAAATVHDAQRTAALTVLRDYFTARRFELRQKVAEQAILRYDESLSIVTARVRAGLASPSDINRMETRRQSEQANLADMAGNAAEARVQLAVELGLSGVPIELIETAEVPPPPPDDSAKLEEFLSTALHDRPDLRAARFTTRAADFAVRVQQANYYPQLSLTGLAQLSNNPFNPLIGARQANSSASPFDNITGSAYLGGTLSINLFDTLNTWTGVRDARFERRRLAEEERRIGRAIETDVRMLHARLLHYYRMREPMLHTREVARDNLEIVRARYKHGDVGLLDLIDAQVELLNSEVGLANAATTIAQTWGELYLAMGRMPS